MLKGGFGPKLYFTERKPKMRLTGRKKYFSILFPCLKTGTVPVFRWGATCSKLQGHQIQPLGHGVQPWGHRVQPCGQI